MVNNCFGNYLLYIGPWAKGNLSSTSGWITVTGEAWVIVGVLHSAGKNAKSLQGSIISGTEALGRLGGGLQSVVLDSYGNGFLEFAILENMTVTKILMRISSALMA